MRRGEVFGVRWEDVDTDRATIIVRHSKTPAGIRIVPLLTPLPNRSTTNGDPQIRRHRARLLTPTQPQPRQHLDDARVVPRHDEGRSAGQIPNSTTSATSPSAA
jgi:hypothetical protein